MKNLIKVLYGVVLWLFIACVVVSYDASSFTDQLIWFLHTIFSGIAILITLLTLILVIIQSIIKKSWKSFFIWFGVCVLLYILIRFSWFLGDIVIPSVV